VINDPQNPSHLFPIDVSIPDKDLYFGDGDFTDCFVALSDTKVRKVNFGSSVFTELYFDFLQAGEIDLDRSISSRVFFDSAKCTTCNFNNSKNSETYFDTAQIKKLSLGNLTTGIIFPAASKIEEVTDNQANLNKYIYAFDKPDQNMFGDKQVTTSKPSDTKKYELTPPRILSISELMEEIRTNPDLRRLGQYAVSNEHVVIDLGDDIFSGIELRLGNGKFASVTFTNSAKLKSLHFDGTHINQLHLGKIKAETVFFSHLNADKINFDSAEIDRCYMDDARATSVYFEESHINEIHAMRLDTVELSMNKLQCNEFNFNRMGVSVVRCDNANLGNLQLSNAHGVRTIHFENAAIHIVNLHESKIDTVHFENATINRAYINKSHVQKVEVQNLVSEFLYVDNVDNSYIGELIAGSNRGVKHFELVRILPGHGIKISDEKKSSFGKISFGPSAQEKNNNDGPKAILH
jgi:uncharacterized protein YjbI with pentapeptide repeats